MRTSLFGIVTLGALIALATVSAQTPPQRFEARVDLVVADFVAVNKNGDPALDLASADLRLTVDGKLRPIKTLELVRVVDTVVPVAGAARSAAPGPPDSPPTTASAVPSGGRRNLFLIFDENSMRPGDERQVQEGAARFLASLGPRDRVAVIALPFGRLDAPLTTDRDVTRRALQEVLGRLPPPPGPTHFEKQRRACDDHERSELALRRLVDVLTGIRGLTEPKTVVLTSSGLLPAGQDFPRPGDWGCTVLTVEHGDFLNVGAVAAEVRAQFYVIQPHGFMIAAGDAPGEPQFLGYRDYHAYLDDQFHGLQDVAGVTGGELFMISGRADEIFAKIARETSAYYLLGFSALAAEANGKPHKIALTTTRKGVTIRARPTFTVR